jgi:uracil-DNA glycosylase family 4
LAATLEGRERAELECEADEEDLREEMLACTACRLREGATQVVPWSGNPGGLAFVGQGPGEEEDAVGESFRGAAGSRLWQEAARAGLYRHSRALGLENCGSLNVVACWPPGDREPRDDERAACFGFFKRQLVALRPLVVVPLGTEALRTWRPGAQISDWRGIPFELGDLWLCPTWHPSFVLRRERAGDGEAVREFRADLLLAATLLWVRQNMPGAALEGAVDAAGCWFPKGWPEDRLPALQEAWGRDGGAEALAYQASKIRQGVRPDQIALFEEMADEVKRLWHVKGRGRAKRRGIGVDIGRIEAQYRD